MIQSRVNNVYSAGGRVELAFAITQHIRDLPLMNYFTDYFGCGKSYTYKKHAEFKCRNFKEIEEKILPFFLKYSILVLGGGEVRATQQNKFSHPS